MGNRGTIDKNTMIRLAANTKLRLVPASDDTVVFHADGVRWNCPATLSAALRLLRNDSACSVGTLCAELQEPALEARFMAFLTALAMGGAIWTYSSPRTSSDV
jgi:hypothetical protein